MSSSSSLAQEAAQAALVAAQAASSSTNFINSCSSSSAAEERPRKRQKCELTEEDERRRRSTQRPVTVVAPIRISPAQQLTRDPISLVLPFLTLDEFATSGALISRVWYSAAQTMRSRRDSLFMEYGTSPLAAEAEELSGSEVDSSSWHALLHTSSLRRHIAHLEAQLSVEDASTQSVPDEFTHQLNQIAHSMSHIESLTIYSSMHAEIVDPDDDIPSRPPSPLYPPDLRSLKFKFAEQPPQWWIKKLFEGITLIPTLCTSLIILESAVIDCMHPASITTSLHKLISLRRLALNGDTPIGIDGYAMDDIRAIPRLVEFEGCQQGRYINRLLAASPPHAFRRIGESAFSRYPEQSLIHVGDGSGPGSPSPVDIDLLLSTSSASLTELNLLPSVSPVFLSRFTQLRTLRIELVDRWRGQMYVPPFSRRDLISAISACRHLERLYFNGFRYSMLFSHVQVEQMLAPLVHLEYFVLCESTRLSSLDFLNRLDHLHRCLRYFSFAISCQVRDEQLVEYVRPLYALTQLHLLHLYLDDEVRDETRLETLDSMFRPHDQMTSSYPTPLDIDPSSHYNSREYEEKGPGELPVGSLPNLQQFAQSYQVDDEEEWQKVVDQFELGREKELFQLVGKA